MSYAEHLNKNAEQSVNEWHPNPATVDDLLQNPIVFSSPCTDDVNTNIQTLLDTGNCYECCLEDADLSYADLIDAGRSGHFYKRH